MAPATNDRSAASLAIRDLTTIEECQQAVELQRQVWRCPDEDLVPASLLIVVAKRGGILAGAFDAGTLVGFVCSFPGLRDGRMSQWSHMLGVAASHRGRGLARHLKIEQRRQALAQGLDLVEWTFDPLQAVNASLNVASLGAIAREYAVDVYGPSSSPLHRGTPTDRLMAEWWIRTPRVEACLQGDGNRDPSRFDAAVRVNRCVYDGWTARCAPAGPGAGAPVVALEIPDDFSRVITEAPDVAMDWRLRTRELFLEWFRRGYRVTGFRVDRERRSGVYLLEAGD